MDESREGISPETGAENEASGVSQEEFSSLLQGISTMAPLVKGFLGQGARDGGARGDSCARREALLCALKPYLSPSRCEAVDYLLRLWRVGDAVRGLL